MPKNEQNVLIPERETRIHPVPSPAGEQILADAEEQAYDALLSIAHHEEWIGEHAGYLLDDKRVLTHTWACERPGYRGWFWTSTVTRAPRSKKVTVDEVSLLPGEDALLSPKWIPWDVRLEAAEEEINERRAAETDSQAEEAAEDEGSASEGDEAAESGRSSRRGGSRSRRGRSGGARGEARSHRRQRRRVRTVTADAEGAGAEGAKARGARSEGAGARSTSAASPVRASRGAVVRGSRRRRYGA